MLLGQMAQILVAPLMGLIAGALLLFGGIFLAVAWNAGVQPLVDAQHYATFSGKAGGHIVESWAALEFDPSVMPKGKLYWQPYAKIAPCAVVEYSGDWGAPLRRAFCGNRFTFGEEFRLDDWTTLAPGIGFAFPRDASGFAREEIRLDKSAFDWLETHPPHSTFMFGKPPPTTALAALREQFDSPVDVATASWTTTVPTLALAYDPKHPELPMPAKYVDRHRQFHWLGLIVVVILGVPGLLVWRMGMSFLFGTTSRALLWLLTIAPLAALPWWGDFLPSLLRHANADWAQIGRDMLDDISGTTRLIASEPDAATLADGKRIIWQLDAGIHADTFGRIHFALPQPAPETSAAALSALRMQASAQVRAWPAAAQTALFLRLRDDTKSDRNRVATVFTTAAEDLVRDLKANPDARIAARKFLLFGMQYNQWDVDALEKSGSTQ